MNVGFIIFIIFSIISLVSSLIEKNNKDKSKETSNDKAGKSSKVYEEVQSIYKQMQQSVGTLEKEINALKNNPEAKLKEVEKRLERQPKNAKQSKKATQKVKHAAAALKDEKRPIERSAAKKIQAFEEKLHAKEMLSLSERIAKIEADPHLSPRQKMNRINMIRMEEDIDRASSLVDFTPDSTLKGIIFSEILGSPKARR
ncbi:hypothetical protein [Macrococcus capreoli]|uniref:hypothetical protein n=1 Tax=Macrococcus capreoli TaxID=2982690 RepID=UPI0021D5DFBD|nr:hypothetical protein [Macrococcus sp. TMW 2.2395]MCU7556878.1 hypothetical protein [Macrococcus sp. TMW 2.2395]